MEKVEIIWIPYRETKPDVEGLYLVKGEKANPQFKGAYYYHPHHGWSGLAHALESLITHFANFPE